jgi:O-antigen ligase
MIKKYLDLKVWGLMQYEIAALTLMLIFLPSFEAPKHLFLISYTLLSLTRQFKDSRFSKFEHIDYIFLGLFVAAFLSTIFASLHGHEWKGFKSFFSVFIFGWTFVRSQYSKNTMKGLFLISILSLLPPLIYGLHEFLVTKHSEFLKINSLGYVNASGLYLSSVASVALGYFLSIKPTKNKLVHYLSWGSLISFFGFCLLIAASRSAFLCFVITASILIFFSTFKFKKILFSILAISVCASFLLKAPVFEKHIRDVRDNNTLAYRDKLWNVSIESIRLFSYKFGTGIDNYGFVDESIVKPAVEGRGEVYDAKNYFYNTLTHNVYLSFLVERGFLGFFSLIAFFIFWGFGLLRNIKKLGQNELHDYLWAGSLSGLCATSIIGIVHSTLAHEPGILALFLFGLYEMYLKLYVKKKT